MNDLKSLLIIFLATFLFVTMILVGNDVVELRKDFSKLEARVLVLETKYEVRGF
jgi:hypothetical protein